MPKNLFDLFKENEHKLKQAPSPKAWSRIERRIQTPPSIAKTRRIHRTAISPGLAAAVALIIGLTVAFIWMVEKNDQQQAMALALQPLEMEELIISTNQEDIQKVTKAVQDQNKIAIKPIKEGRSEQKLVATIDKSDATSSTSQSSVDNMRDERMGR